MAEQVAVGKWMIRNRFYTSPVINQWGIIYFGSKPDNRIINILKGFENQLPPVSQHYLSSILVIYIEYLVASSIWHYIQITTSGDG